VRALLGDMRQEIARALPKHLTVDRLTRVALTSCVRTPDLLDCSKTSLANAILQAAQLGLEPDGVLGYAYLVPFKGTATLIPGYKGLLDLARRSGRIESIEVRVVHAKDSFKFAYGMKPVLEHKPFQGDEAGELIAVYAIARFREGGVQWEWMWKREIDAIRKRSRAATTGPWVTDYEAMAAKTVLRRLAKLLPASVELQRAVALDERAELGLPLDDIPVEIVSVVPDTVPPKSKLDALTEQLQGRGKPEPDESDSHTFPPPQAA
jgi:recombination protein RecT